MECLKNNFKNRIPFTPLLILTLFSIST
ncbi:MAG: hypothetical protein ACI9YL_001839, partial [Luteibaculaceae bacterium]